MQEVKQSQMGARIDLKKSRGHAEVLNLSLGAAAIDKIYMNTTIEHVWVYTKEMKAGKQEHTDVS